ncbi:nitrile hydratase accessory protein [Chachezhania antarctica]|uniref:nitrile hydratase accessory protein n=1 Tax=Chachezhania antarctica TaxID=2340860 RepID=UPI000EAC709D|nr:nitrile hydratase accessory protein [Chachezhania antarctica]|tara:strand:- start:2014 stop:2346 length:333 start_codon:yes stop_codon:yes gene_type:complete
MTDNAPEPVFEAPWHAQVFALTVHLNESGLFAWPDWAERFGAGLKARGLERELDGGEDYFLVWLEVLESFLAELGQAAPDEVERVRADWEAAYLTTPHGEPVVLKGGVRA